MTSRILPVKIHDLDTEDKILLENELGGTLRGIEFIYKSAGVNRPLRPNEDHPKENLNKTYYRDQINKVANAVKEIISSAKNKEFITDGTTSDKSLIPQTRGLAFRKKLAGRNVLRASLVYILTALVFWKVVVICSGLINMTDNIIKLVTLMLIVLFPFAILLAWWYERSPKGFIRTGSAASVENPYRNEQKKPFTSITFMALLLVTTVALFFLFPQTRRTEPNKGITEVEKSIAVLPFVNDSPDEENAYFINGVMDEILNNLQKIKDFRVLSRTSTTQFKGSTKLTIPEIAKKLNVNFIVEGSGQKYGNTIHLSVQLIAAKNEKHLWGDTYEKETSATKDIFNIESQVAQTIASRLQATITPEEKKLIEKIPTINLTAYDFYQRGQEEIDKHRWPEYNAESLKRAEVFFRKALEYDSSYAQAYYGLAEIHWIKSDLTRTYNNSERSTVKIHVDSMLILADKALSYDEHLEGPYIIRAAYFGHRGDFKKNIEELDKAIHYNPNDYSAYQKKGESYEEVDMVKALENFQKAASLNHDSKLTYLLTKIGMDYYKTGFPEKGKYFFLEALKLDGDSVKYSDRIIYHTEALHGDYKKAIEHFEKRYLKDSTELEVLDDLGALYSFTGEYKESLKYYKKYLSLIRASEQTNPFMSSLIGYAFLQNGYRKEADYYFDKKIESIDTGAPPNPNDIYWVFPLAAIYACRGDKVKAYKYLEIFNQNQYFTLDWVTLLKNHPLFSSIRKEPVFQRILRDVEAKYQAQHERVGKWLKEQGENL